MHVKNPSAGMRFSGYAVFSAEKTAEVAFAVAPQTPSEPHVRLGKTRNML